VQNPSNLPLKFLSSLHWDIVVNGCGRLVLLRPFRKPPSKVSKFQGAPSATKVGFVEVKSE
jgi:hypothetical protein